METDNQKQNRSIRSVIMDSLSLITFLYGMYLCFVSDSWFSVFKAFAVLTVGGIVFLINLVITGLKKAMEE